MRTYRVLLIALAALCVALMVHAAGSLHVASGTWVNGPAMSVERTGAATVLMPDGRLLVTGGSDAAGNALSSAEFVNADGSISEAPAMSFARSGHSAVWLPTGYVLVAGGKTSGGGVTNTAELFDPLANNWVTLPSTLVEARTDFTATVLRFGNVVIAGGTHAGVPVNTVEVFDVSQETFSSIGALNVGRANAAAAAIGDWKVLVAGGSDANGSTLASTEIIDTEAGTISAGPALNSPRQSPSATLLLDGRVLVAGGSYPEGADANGGVAELASTDIYDPVAGTVSAGPAMSAPRAEHQAFLLPNNNGVLLVGGVSAGQDLASADLYTPASGSFAAQASMTVARKQGTGSAMQNPAFGGGVDGVLFVGGGSNQSSSDFYGFATVKTDKDDYAPGTPVIITGSGWVPGETVSLSLLESPALDTHTLTPVVADANGNIYSDEFAPDVNDMGVRFYLTAAGSKSVARNAFSDATATTTSITSSPNPSNTNQSVVLTATVTAGSTPVTVGSVSFYNQTGITNPNCTGQTGTQIGTTQSLNSSGKASVSTTFATPGSYKLGACYNGTGGGTGTQNSQSSSITQSIVGKVDPSFTSLVGGTVSYGDTSVTLSGGFSNTPKPTGSVNITVNGVTQSATINGSGNFSSTFNPSTFPANATGYTITYSYAGDTNYNSVSDTTQKLIVNKAVLTITADDKSMTFGGAVPALTYTPAGFRNSETSSVLSGAPSLSTTATSSSPVGSYPITITAGTLAATNYSFAFVNGNLAVGKADVSVAWSNTSATYDGSSHAITATPTPSAAALTITYTGTDNGGTAYNSTTPPTNAGNYTATATLSDTTNYKFAAAAQTTSPFTISKADPTINVTGYTGSYDGDPHGATGTAKGAKGETLSGLDLGASFTNVPGGTANWTFTDATGNYNNKTGSAAIVINKADASVTVTGYTGVYDATQHGATGNASGVKGEALPGLDLGAKFTDVPGGTAHWTFTGGTNYKDQSGDAAIVINKADAIVTVNGYTGTYDAAAHGATGTATGVGGVDLGAGLSLGATFTDAPGGTAHWTFAGGTNYNDAAGNVQITISKADAHVVVNGYNGTYDGASHGATGSASGVGSVDLSAGLSLGATFTDAPGGTAHWTFTGGTNYKDQSGDAAIVITKADATVNVSGYTGVYDGIAHGASGSVKGVGGVDLPGLTLGASFTDVPGGTAHWAFSGGTNYNDQSGDVAITISKAGSTTVVTCGGPYTFNGAAQTPCSVSVTGIGGLSLTPAATYINNVNAGIATASYSYPGDTNHDPSSDSKPFTIQKALVTATAGTYIGVYDAAAHSPSACVVSGAYTGDLACTNNPPTVGPDVSSGSVAPVTTGTGIEDNFTVAVTNGSYSISQAASITTVMCPVSVTYNGAAQTPCTASVSGAGLSLSPAPTYSNNLNAGQATASYSYGGDLNHTASSDSKNFTIAKAPTSATIDSGYTVVFDNKTHGVTANVTGAGGLNQPIAVSYTPGGTNLPLYPGSYAASASYLGDSNHLPSNAASSTINIIYGTCNAALGPGNVILPPINSDGSSVYNRKGGSTIPVKFRVCDAYGNSISDPAAVFGTSSGSMTMLSAVRGTVTVVNESTTADIPDVAFRYSGGQWIFNMATSNLDSGSTYVFRINLKNGNILFQVGVK